MDTPPLPQEVNNRLVRVEDDISHLRTDVDRLNINVDQLNTNVAQLNTSVAVILSNYCTKEDLCKLRNEMHQGFFKLVLLMMAFGSTLTAAVYYIARNVH
jgi:hypothetical protein